MLLLDTKQREINGITVFPDHADPMQYYYLPLAPHLTTIHDNVANADVPQFSLVRFRGEAGTGGFLNFDVNIGVDSDQLDEIRRKIRGEVGLNDLPRLAPVTTVSGTVRLLMLGKQSGTPPSAGAAGGGGAAGAAPTDGPQFVLTMDHAVSPSLYGSNQAAFSIKLDAAGVAVIEKSLDGEILPIAVVYSLDYLGLRPAYHVHLSIDWDRVQKHLDETYSGGFLFSSVDISNTVDKLVEDRAIVLEADTFVPEGEANKDVTARRDAALNQVRAMITDAFFQPTLPPIQPGKEEEWSKALRIAAGVAGAIGMGPGAMMASSTFFSYRKATYKRIDKKKLNVDFSERVTVERSIHPQGHLAGLFRLMRDMHLPTDRFIIDARLDDPWFQKRKLNVFIDPAYFSHDALASINVHARYGGDNKNAFLTADTAAHDFEWLSVIENGAMKEEVDLQVDVEFAPADAGERPTKLSGKTIQTTEDRSSVNPRDLYSVLTVPITADGFPFDHYPAVEAHMHYRDADHGLEETRVFRLTADSPEATWQVFMLDTDKRAFDYRLVYRAADNRDVDDGWKQGTEDQLSIRDPFPTKLSLLVVPNVNWDEVAQVFVDLRYEDKANHINEEKSLDFSKGSPMGNFAVSVQNPEQRQIFYKVTFLFADGRMTEVPESVTMERRIIVRPDMKGRRIVEVRAPTDFAQRDLKRVTTEVRFEDLAAGLSFADSFTFQDDAGRGYFEFDYIDEQRNRYEAKSTFLFQNGFNQETDWASFNDPVLQVETP